jgi:hypothetical protein
MDVNALRSCTRARLQSAAEQSVRDGAVVVPGPPSPPSGGPSVTRLSRKKATQPFPPLPALTRTLILSMNLCLFCTTTFFINIINILIQILLIKKSENHKTAHRSFYFVFIYLFLKIMEKK